MEFIHNHNTELGVRADIALASGNVTEGHAIVHVEGRGEDFPSQYRRVLMGVERLMDTAEMRGMTVVFRRYFLSDISNQAPVIREMGQERGAVSLIQQPPLDGGKLALWLYLVGGAEVEYDADEMGSAVVRADGCEHIWTMGMQDAVSVGSYDQTTTVLERYESLLSSHYGINIADDCVRTWFFVRDVDTNYAGLVRSRRENFLRNGLTPDTHYISSTGIGGSPEADTALVQMGCYAVKGLQPGQQQYLYALDHLNRTIEYGVTFERGTVLNLPDRRVAYISGTASINNRGEVVHVGDVRKQTLRMWENVDALLVEGGMTSADIMQIIVYLRDITDYNVVERMFCERFPDVPYVITLAPVCRPAWLIEMECVACCLSEK